MAAPQGLPMEPCCVAQGQRASLHTHGSLRASPLRVRRRRQSHCVGDASASSLFWARKNSWQTVYPKERGTQPYLLLPWWVSQSFPTLSLQVPICFPWLTRCASWAPAHGVPNKIK